MKDIIKDKIITWPATQNKLEENILSKEALTFLVELFENFNDEIDTMLCLRENRANNIKDGNLPDFIKETKPIRIADWQVATPPHDLLDRRIEITGPVNRKIIINALNSGANVFMADFEDSHSPTWQNTIDGQVNLFDAVRKTISFKNNKTNKSYKLNENPAVLMVRPRGLHLLEKNITINNEYIHASLVDFGLYFFHNAHELLKRKTGPYFYIPKLEHYEEARLWNNIFLYAQERLDIPKGKIKATVLIETLPAAFQMDEILYHLKDHSAGLNCGRWDYIFSFIKTLKDHKEFTLPNRSDLTMDKHFMRSYTQLLIKTCHRRQAHAIGGMSALIPIKNDKEANSIALEAVKKDKIREVTDGHDGTWVAHPGLIEMTKEIFDHYMPQKNQIGNKRLDVNVVASDLLTVPQGKRTEDDIRKNINVSLQYISAWLMGKGCVPINNLMEDAATVEISRALIWHWVRFNVETDDGIVITKGKIEELLKQEIEKLQISYDIKSDDIFLTSATKIFSKIALDMENFSNFLTLQAYDELLNMKN